MSTLNNNKACKCHNSIQRGSTTLARQAYTSSSCNRTVRAAAYIRSKGPSPQSLPAALQATCSNGPGAQFDEYLGCFSTLLERSRFIPSSAVKGQIPKDLRGTLLRNGPGNFSCGAPHVQHPLDGDGVVTAYAFSNGKVFMRRKFPRTKALRGEMEAGRQLYKGVHTIGEPAGPFSWPFDVKLRQPANSAVLYWAGKVLALHERDLPYAMDHALNTMTRDSSTLGVWNDDDVMASHYRITTEEDGSKRLCTWGAIEDGTDLKVKILEVNEAGKKEAETHQRIPGAAFNFMHDILVTENYYVLIENPTRMDVWRLASEYTFGKASLAQCLHAEKGRPMKIHCLPRPGKEGRDRVVYETAASAFSVHHVNAWEANSSTIVVDTLVRDSPPFTPPTTVGDLGSPKAQEGATTLRRLVMRGTAVLCREYDTREAAGLQGWSLDFPNLLPPRASREVPGSSTVEQCIVKVEIPPLAGVSTPWDPSDFVVQAYHPGAEGAAAYCGEPVFVAKPGAAVGGAFTGDDGYILVHVQDLREEGGERTWLEVLDAGDIGAGPLAAIDLQELVPPGLHGYWVDDAYLGPTPNETIPMKNDIRYHL